MKKTTTYIVLMLAALMGLSGCTGCFNKKQTNWNVTLQQDSKIPYGSYLAFRSLKYYFPQARIEAVSKGFRYENIEDGMRLDADSAALLVLNGLDFYVSDNELEDLVSFAKKGNEIFLICSRMDNKLEERFGCSKEQEFPEEYPLSFVDPGKKNVRALSLLLDSAQHYGMEGRSLLGYFSFIPPDTTAQATEADSTSSNADDYVNKKTVTIDDENSDDAAPEILGKTLDTNVNFIRYRVGKGHITLHAAPLAFSNYFLLQPGNTKYLDGVWQSFPANISHIYWNDYFKRHREHASIWMLFKYEATRWALLIAIITLLLYVLFESKRRQRIIPIVPKLENSSVTFVETVGRLYFNKGNHHNLGEKMIQHFLDWVRTHYYLNTNQINEAFTQQLIIKSNLPESTVREMIRMVNEVRLREVSIDEAYLYHLHNTIQQFYKK